MMDKEKKLPELSDVRIMLIIKAALEFNASVVSHASFIYGQDFKPRVRQRASKELQRLAKDYGKKVQEILEAKES